MTAILSLEALLSANKPKGVPNRSRTKQTDIRTRRTMPCNFTHFKLEFVVGVTQSLATQMHVLSAYRERNLLVLRSTLTYLQSVLLHT